MSFIASRRECGENAMSLKCAVVCGHHFHFTCIYFALNGGGTLAEVERFLRAGCEVQNTLRY